MYVCRYTYSLHMIFLPPSLDGELLKIIGGISVTFWSLIENFCFQTGSILGHHFKDKC